MLNIKKNGEFLHIKGSRFMYAWMTVFVFGSLSACIFLIGEGFSFESNYSLIYLGTGIVFLPYMSYLAIWFMPGFKIGKILFSVTPKKWHCDI